MIYTIVNIAFFTVSLIIIFIGLFGNLEKVKGNKYIGSHIYKKIEVFVDNNYKKIVVFIFVLAIFTSLYKLGIVPYGLHVDEAGMAYDALSLSKYGVDRFLNKFPVYLINYGGGQSAMYAYMTAILIKLFGYSSFIIRMPAVIIRILLIICGFLTVKDNKNKMQSLIILTLLTIVPYFIMQSRWGLDCNLLVGLLTISVYFFVKAINKNDIKLYIISGIFFGLSLYTYVLSYIIIPCFLLLSLIYLLYIKKIKFTKIIIFGIPIFILALPLISMILVNNGILSEIKGFITIPLLPGYRGSELSFFNLYLNNYIYTSLLSFDNTKVFGDILIYNALPQFGTLYYMTIPFVLVGFVVCLNNLKTTIKTKEFNLDAIILFWFISVIICQLFISQPNINKANAIFFPLVYFIVQGIIYIINKFKLAIIPIMLMLFLNFGLFLNYYFNHYNLDYMNQYFFATYYLDALEYGRNLNIENIYLENDLTAQSYIYPLLLNDVSPYEYNEKVVNTVYKDQTIIYHFTIPDEIDVNAVYIVDNNSLLAKQLSHVGFNEQKFGWISVFWN